MACMQPCRQTAHASLGCLAAHNRKEQLFTVQRVKCSSASSKKQRSLKKSEHDGISIGRQEVLIRLFILHNELKTNHLRFTGVRVVKGGPHARSSVGRELVPIRWETSNLESPHGGVPRRFEGLDQRLTQRLDGRVENGGCGRHRTRLAHGPKIMQPGPLPCQNLGCW